MLERLTDVPPGIVAVKAIGKLTREDYEEVVRPLLDQARQEGRRIRLLTVVGPEFRGFTPGGAWEDIKIGLQSLRLFDGCAIVTDTGWIWEATRFVKFLMPCPVRVYGSQEYDQAIAWLSALPENAGISHRLIPESGIIVVEVKQPLRAQDFDALALTADSWIEAQGDLRGLVIHAREFPGWENVGSLVRHVRFVRDHHRKVKRVALAADSALAKLVPSLAEHFVDAELKSFGYDELDRAVAWAAQSPGPRP